MRLNIFVKQDRVHPPYFEGVRKCSPPQSTREDHVCDRDPQSCGIFRQNAWTFTLPDSNQRWHVDTAPQKSEMSRGIPGAGIGLKSFAGSLVFLSNYQGLQWTSIFEVHETGWLGTEVSWKIWTFVFSVTALPLWFHFRKFLGLRLWRSRELRLSELPWLWSSLHSCSLSQSMKSMNLRARRVLWDNPAQDLSLFRRWDTGVASQDHTACQWRARAGCSWLWPMTQYLSMHQAFET